MSLQLPGAQKIEGIKSWTLKCFPRQIYYNVHEDHVEL